MALLKIHAGCVVRSGTATLLPGPNGVGKSTLVTSLLARGFSFLSDDEVAIDSESLRAFPAPRPIFLREDAVEVLPQSIRKTLVRHSESVWRLDEGVLSKTRHPGPVPVNTVVILDPERRDPPSLIHLGQIEAVTHLLQQCRSFDELGPQAVTILTALVKKANLLKLSSGELEATVRLLAAHLP